MQADLVRRCLALRSGSLRGRRFEMGHNVRQILHTLLKQFSPYNHSYCIDKMMSVYI